MKYTPTNQQINVYLKNAIATAFFKHFSKGKRQVPNPADVPSMAGGLDSELRLQIVKKQVDLSVFPNENVTDIKLHDAINVFIDES